jgi:hypothetical protein
MQPTDYLSSTKGLMGQTGFQTLKNAVDLNSRLLSFSNYPVTKRLEVHVSGSAIRPNQIVVVGIANSDGKRQYQFSGTNVVHNERYLRHRNADPL